MPKQLRSSDNWKCSIVVGENQRIAGFDLVEEIIKYQGNFPRNKSDFRS